MLTEAQKAKFAEWLKSDEAKADDAAEKLEALVSPIIQTAAASVVEGELKGIKANRDEFRADLDKYKPLGKPETISEALEELKTLRAAKGKNLDEKEIRELVATRASEKAAAMIAEEATKTKAAYQERDEFKALSEKAIAAILDARRSALLNEYAPDVKPLMRPYFEQRLGEMLQPVETENGEPWWAKKDTPFRVVDPISGNPLPGKNGVLSPRELVEAARGGLGENPWDSKDFSETFFVPKGKNDHPYRPPGEMPVTSRGHVDPSASSEHHFAALIGKT